jgi:hypothetical protein
MAVVSLHAPVALARTVHELTPSGVRDLVWEPKWDGYRALIGAGRIYSRNGTNLTPLFPDLTPVLAARLPPDLVLDGEVIAWDPGAGRLDFDGLQARMTAGRRIRAVAARRPAQLVVFDVLAAGTQDLRGRALRERRAVLEQALAGMASPIVVCQQTDDVVLAREWFHMLTAGGIEGLIVKDAGGSYRPCRVSECGGRSRPSRASTCSPSGSPVSWRRRARWCSRSLVTSTMTVNRSRLARRPRCRRLSAGPCRPCCTPLVRALTAPSPGARPNRPG